MIAYKKILLLIFTRGISLGAFFAIYALTPQHIFNEYALYFSAWQILTQLVGMQIGTALFRCSFSKKGKGHIEFTVKIIAKAAIPTYTLLLVIAVLSETVFLYSLSTAIIFAYFNATAEFARARENENRIFASYCIPPVIVIAIISAFYVARADIALSQIFQIEISSYLLAHAIILKLQWQKINQSPLKKEYLKKIFYDWKSNSAPLISNNIILYSYANLPQIISYYLEMNESQFAQQAIVTRLIAIASTISAIVSLAFQKEIMVMYEKSGIMYLKYKSVFLYKIPVLALVLLIAAGIAIKLIIDYASLKGITGRLDIISEYVIELSMIAWLFFINYVSANFFMAERKLHKAAKAMAFGFVVYIFFVYIQTHAYLTPHVYTTSLIAALSVTIIIRYKLLNE